MTGLALVLMPHYTIDHSHIELYYLNFLWCLLCGKCVICVMPRWGEWLSFITGPPKIQVKEQSTARWLVMRPQPQGPPPTPPIWGTGWQCWKHSKIFFTQALTGEDPEQKALGIAWDTWEQPMFPCGWSPVSCRLFLWHIFLKCSHSGHFTLCWAALS